MKIVVIGGSGHIRTYLLPGLVKALLVGKVNPTRKVLLRGVEQMILDRDKDDFVYSLRPLIVVFLYGLRN